MAVTPTHCGTLLEDDATCWCVPSEFVRPRFYYGQRLGVVDFCDWLWYHAGKQRFHNLRGHGSGVLCGLRAARYEVPGQDASTLLRVDSGAALDACGREVVVGVDQCIDVAAWFLQNRDRAQVADWADAAAEEERRLYVGLRYRECPSDPAPAPRDPCGCDAGGCEYSRVREGFELALFTHDEMVASLSPPNFPTSAELQGILASLVAHGTAVDPWTTLHRSLHALVASECPPPVADPWLWLACFDVVFEGDRIVDLRDVNNTIPQRMTLLSTAALQEMVVFLATSAAENGAFGPGPRITGLRFDGSAPGTDRLELAIDLAPVMAGSSDSPLVGGTVELSFVKVRKLDPSTGWGNASPDTFDYSDAPSPNLFCEWNSGTLTAGDYRLTIAPPPEEPIADERGRPLRPLVFSRSFRLVVDSDTGNLVLDEAAI